MVELLPSMCEALEQCPQHQQKYEDYLHLSSIQQ